MQFRLAILGLFAAGLLARTYTVDGIVVALGRAFVFATPRARGPINVHRALPYRAERATTGRHCRLGQLDVMNSDPMIEFFFEQIAVR